MTIAIEKGVPIPKERIGKTGVAQALRSMSAGDSFLIEESKRVSIYAQAKALAVAIKVSKVAPGQIRVWRIE